MSQSEYHAALKLVTVFAVFRVSVTTCNIPVSCSHTFFVSRWRLYLEDRLLSAFQDREFHIFRSRPPHFLLSQSLVQKSQPFGNGFFPVRGWRGHFILRIVHLPCIVSFTRILSPADFTIRFYYCYTFRLQISAIFRKLQIESVGYFSLKFSWAFPKPCYVILA